MKINEKSSDPSENIPVTDFVGLVPIGKAKIPCAVLYPDREEPIRVFSQREVVGLLTGNVKGNLDRYFKPENLQPFLPEKYKTEDLSKSTILFKVAGTSRISHGFIGSDIIDICKMYMDADAQGKLLKGQKHLALQAQVIVLAFAKTGVDAVIDAATGFEKVRPDYAVMRNLQKYVNEELKRYVSQFPIDFYKQIYRLNGWSYTDESIKRKPGIVGKWTNDIIYSRFPKGVFAKISELNSRDEKGRLKNRNYYFLTEKEGLQALTEYIKNAMFLMGAAPNWRKFMNMLRRTLGKDYQGEIWE